MTPCFPISTCRRWNRSPSRALRTPTCRVFLLKPPGFDASKKIPGEVPHPRGDRRARGAIAGRSAGTRSSFAATGGYVGGDGQSRTARPATDRRFTDEVSGDWGGQAVRGSDERSGLRRAAPTRSSTNHREAALGASYGGYMINWILGHPDRFKCLVSHDGLFDAVAAYGETEELWFNEWEYKGTPWDNPENVRESGRRTSLRRTSRRRRWSSTGSSTTGWDVAQGFELFTTLQTPEGAVEDAVFPRRGALGAQAAEQPPVEQDGQRLGGSVGQVRARSNLLSSG